MKAPTISPEGFVPAGGYSEYDLLRDNLKNYREFRTKAVRQAEDASELRMKAHWYTLAADYADLIVKDTQRLDRLQAGDTL